MIELSKSFWAFESVVGVTGHKAAGKDTLGEYLCIEYGYKQIGCGDAVRAEAKARGLTSWSVSKDLVDIGNWGRQAHFNGFWVGRILQLAAEQKIKKLVISGIRHPEEIDFLQGVVAGHAGSYKRGQSKSWDGGYVARSSFLIKNLAMLGVTAPILTRWDRFQARAKADDPKTVEDFLKLDDIDRGIGQSYGGQQSDRTLAMVPYQNVINNDSSVEEFKANIKQVLAL